jgi:serine/threonine protein kinase
VKVLDFGIAKKLDRLTTGVGVKTHTGSVLGSPFYMSPEQATGLPSIDHRSDIWSFAVVAYECLTGTRPFERDTLGAVFTAISQEPLPIPSRVAAVPRGFDQWFARAAARHPDVRFQSAAEAAQELRAVCEQPIDVALTSTAVIPTRRLSAIELSVTPSDTAPPSAVTVSGLAGTRVRSWKLALVPLIALAIVMLYFTWRVKRDVPPAASALPEAQPQPALSTSAGEPSSPSVPALVRELERENGPQPETTGAKDVAKGAKRVTLPAALSASKRIHAAGSPSATVPPPAAHSQEDVFVGF